MNSVIHGLVRLAVNQACLGHFGYVSSFTCTRVEMSNPSLVCTDCVITSSTLMRGYDKNIIEGLVEKYIPLASSDGEYLEIESVDSYAQDHDGNVRVHVRTTVSTP